MGERFTPAVHEAVELIWGHADADSARRGQDMLQQAAEAGDADAWGLLARTYMGQGAVWENSGLPQVNDEETVHAYILKSIAGGRGSMRGGAALVLPYGAGGTAGALGIGRGRLGGGQGLYGQGWGTHDVFPRRGCL